MQLQTQFEELKSDFQYNLQLLAERDAELEQADAAAGKAAAEHAAKATTISQLQAQLAQAQSGEISTLDGLAAAAEPMVLARVWCFVTLA